MRGQQREVGLYIFPLSTVNYLLRIFLTAFTDNPVLNIAKLVQLNARLLTGTICLDRVFERDSFWFCYSEILFASWLFCSLEFIGEEYTMIGSYNSLSWTWVLYMSAIYLPRLTTGMIWLRQWKGRLVSYYAILWNVASPNFHCKLNLKNKKLGTCYSLASKVVLWKSRFWVWQQDGLYIFYPLRLWKVCILNFFEMCIYYLGFYYMCSSGRRGSLVITKSMDWTMKEIKDYETSERNKYEDKLQLYELWTLGYRTWYERWTLWPLKGFI